MPDDKADDKGTTGNDTTDNKNTAGETDDSTPATWDKFLETQSPEVRKLHDDNTAGLKNALTSERQQRKDLEAQLREAAAKAEEGSEAKKLLTEQADTLQGLEDQAAFYDDAHTQGVTNLKLAWMAAQETDAFDRKGNVNWELLKTQFPELFSKSTVPPGDAGRGTQGPPDGDEKDMNKYIRAAAGR